MRDAEGRGKGRLTSHDERDRSGLDPILVIQRGNDIGFWHVLDGAQPPLPGPNVGTKLD